ncbi:tetratricopeptide repeat protein [Candidatus Giovannonibacteria bacterium]|nr:tetratricopeptide repeat protein [Candidatus Giovannonibacteria bacterium]
MDETNDINSEYQENEYFESGERVEIETTDSIAEDSLLMEEVVENGFFFKIGQWCILALATLLPVWFLPTTVSPIDFNKSFLVFFLILAALICYLLNAVFRGKVFIGANWIFISMILAALLWMLSATFSMNSGISLWGVAAENTTFLSITMFFIFSWLIAMLFGEEHALSRLFFALVLGFSLLLLILIFSISGFGAKFGGLFANSGFNPIGSWNSAALSIGFFIMLLYPFLMWVGGKWRVIFGLLFAASLVLLVLINFTLPWIFVGFFALMLLSYSIWRRNLYRASIILPLFMVIIALSWYFLNGFIKSPIDVQEVGVSHTSTIQIVKESLKENFYLGSGPANFGFLWEKFKPAAVNSTPYWGVRFTAGSSFFLTTLAEVGIFGWIFLVAVILGIWILGMKSLSGAQNPMQETMSLSAFLLTSYAVLMLALYSTGFTLVALSFLAFGFTLATLRTIGKIKIREVAIFGEGPKGLVSAMVVVFLIIISFGGVYVVASKYIAQIQYAKGINIFNTTGNLDEAEKKILLSSRLDGNNDLYFRDLSQIHMLRAQAALRDNATPKDLLASRFKDALDKAINSSQSAISASPQEFLNYRNLGKIYESLISLNTAGAHNAAITQYDFAIKYAPKNPLLLRDEAGVFIAEALTTKNLGLLPKAEEALVKATELKPDYAEAHFLLAQIFDAEGKSDEAIRRGEAAALLMPNDIGSLFQLGLLYYKANRLLDAEIVLQRATEINIDYSNARYFLGLIYDKTNRREQAISEFNKITRLNPDNDEVKRILANLNAGKVALSGIVPPAQAPEKRTEAPVKEKGDASLLLQKKGR